MITIRKSADRGRADHGWLDSRLINEDRVEAGQGFGTHPHRDMEIISYVLEGALEHKDSMGTASVIRPGEVQRMTAGTGVLHSEYNPSRKEPVHFLQIWILPEKRNLKPGYEQKAYPDAERKDRLRLVASRDGRDGSLTIHQDAELYTTLLSRGESVSHPLKAGRHAWVQVARGVATLNGKPLATGDGAAVSGEKALELNATADAEVLLFDLA
jgi:redox-sensitive bicupin YhaK (pirin superfamily)